jgi:hypothetical protein
MLLQKKNIVTFAKKVKAKHCTYNLYLKLPKKTLTARFLAESVTTGRYLP